MKYNFSQRVRIYENLKLDSLTHFIWLRDEKALDKYVLEINDYFFGKKNKELFEWMDRLINIGSIYSCETSFSIIEKRTLGSICKAYQYLCCYIRSNLSVPRFSPVHKPYTYYEGRLKDLLLTMVLSVILNDKIMLKECVCLIDGLRENDFEEQFVAL